MLRQAAHRRLIEQQRMVGGRPPGTDRRGRHAARHIVRAAEADRAPQVDVLVVHRLFFVRVAHAGNQRPGVREIELELSEYLPGLGVLRVIDIKEHKVENLRGIEVINTLDLVVEVVGADQPVRGTYAAGETKLLGKRVGFGTEGRFDKGHRAHFGIFFLQALDVAE